MTFKEYASYHKLSKSIKTLHFSTDCDLKDLYGIKEFKNLYDLDITNSEIENLDELPEGLKTIRISNSVIKNINYLNEGLEDLYIFSSGFKEININCKFPNSLLRLAVTSRELGNFPKELPNLLEISVNRSTNADKIVIPDSIEVLDFCFTSVKTLVLPKNLKELWIMGTKELVDLNVDKCVSEVEWHLNDSSALKKFKTFQEFYIHKNLKTDSDKRGEASILDTGLFDFKTN